MKKLLTSITTITLSLILLFTSALPTLASVENLNKLCSTSNISQPTTKTVKVSKVTLNKKTTTINVGSSETLIPTITPANATNQNVTWKSSNKSIATVDSTGKVIGLKEGKTTITVTTTDGKKTATCAVSVTKKATGSIKGVLTWQYNRYIGTKADVGARVALIPKNYDKTKDNSFFAIMLKQIPQGKDGIYTGIADGYGNYQIDDIPTGQYYLLISSKNTTSNMIIDSYTSSVLSNLFSVKDWSSLQLELKLNKYYFNSIEIKDGKILTESHDFGYTYY